RLSRPEKLNRPGESARGGSVRRWHRPSLANQSRMLLSDFANLGQGMMLDVRLVGIVARVVLVVRLGGIKFRERLQRRHDRPRKSAGLIEPLDLGRGGVPLFI